MSPRWSPDPRVRRGRSVISNLHAHLVFVTKYRRAVFTRELLDACEEVMGKVCEDFAVDLVEFNGEGDHVHLLIQYPLWCVKVFGQFGYATWVTCVVCCSHACAGVWYPSAEWGRIRL